MTALPAIAQPPLVGLGLTEAESRWLELPPAVCDELLHKRLIGIGVTGELLRGVHQTDAIAYAAVVFLDPCRFEFASDLSDACGHEAALIIPLTSSDWHGTLDLAAISLDGIRVGRWLGRAPVSDRVKRIASALTAGACE